ncbi:unnamed protein product [Prunus armeniaca]
MKLRHYMLPFTTYIIAKAHLIKYMLTRPMLRERISKCTLALSEFVFKYVPQKSIKGQATADFWQIIQEKKLRIWIPWT